MRCGFFFRSSAGFFGGEQFIEMFIIQFLVCLVQLDILAYKPVTFFSDESDLVLTELLSPEGSDLQEISQIAFDAGFGVIGVLLDLGKGVAFEVKVKDGGFM